MTRTPAVTILTSGIGLGVYIPALLIQAQLRTQGLHADVEVLEGYYTPERQSAHLAHKAAFHADFALAEVANRMPHDAKHCLDSERIDALIQRWYVERRNRFVVWSGFWLPVLERYRQFAGALQLQVDHCRIDAEMPASFRIYPDLSPAGREIWFWNWNEKKIVHEITVSHDPPIPFHQREDRLVVHGGGWGIGSYSSAAKELERKPYSLDRVIHALAEWRCARGNDRCFMIDPQWHPWMRGPDGSHEFPPMGEVVSPAAINWQRNQNFHPFFEVIRRSKAIVSKPGGCTLLDSLSSATPVILLEPCGQAEKSNFMMWEHLGFGISFSKWRDRHYDASLLERMYFNIMTRTTSSVDYSRSIAAELLQETAL